MCGKNGRVQIDGTSPLERRWNWLMFRPNWTSESWVEWTLVTSALTYTDFYGFSFKFPTSQRWYDWRTPIASWCNWESGNHKFGLHTKSCSCAPSLVEETAAIMALFPNGQENLLETLPCSFQQLTSLQAHHRKLNGLDWVALQVQKN